VPTTAPVRIGIVGVGRMGRRHAENLALRVPGAELVAACSPIGEELEWARDTLGVPGLYKDYAELLAHPGLDAVFLVTPVTLHPAQIIAGLQAGKHVFCEKPLSLDLDECLAVEAEAARHPHLKVMIGFVRRFDASYQDAQKSIAAGAIGRPFMVRSETCDQNDPSGFFVRFAPTSGGIFVDMSVHDIDLARWLLGSPRPLRVFSVGNHCDPRRPARVRRRRQRSCGVRVRRRPHGVLLCVRARWHTAMRRRPRSSAPTVG
jgi:myo-inositol 2-dehydrogenase/D-chiro-inositol 1-dehydrogenase